MNALNFVLKRRSLAAKMLSTFAFGALVLSVAAWKPGNNHQTALLQKPKSVSVPFRVSLTKDNIKSQSLTMGRKSPGT